MKAETHRKSEVFPTRMHKRLKMTGALDTKGNPVQNGWRGRLYTGELAGEAGNTGRNQLKSLSSFIQRTVGSHRII